MTKKGSTSEMFQSCRSQNSAQLCLVELRTCVPAGFHHMIFPESFFLIDSCHSDSLKRSLSKNLQTEELVKALQDLENAASGDAAVRQKIASLPQEVQDVSLLEKITGETA